MWMWDLRVGSARVGVFVAQDVSEMKKVEEVTGSGIDENVLAISVQIVKLWAGDEFRDSWTIRANRVDGDR